MIDTIVICILILVYMTMTLAQGHTITRNQSLLRQLHHEVLNRFEWILIYIWAVFVWWTSYLNCMSCVQYLRERPQLRDFVKKKKTQPLTWAFIQIVADLISFKLES